MHLILFNSEIYKDNDPIITAFNRGLTLADGVFETIKISDGYPELLEPHLRRLNNGCHVMRLDYPDTILQQIKKIIAINHIDHAALKIIITRKSYHRGLDITGYSASNIIISLAALPTNNPKKQRAMISHICRNDTSPLSRIKSLNYGDNMMALLDAKSKGFDDALMLNTKGEICCFTAGNIVIETHNGDFVTPPTDIGCLEGCYLTTLSHVHYAPIDLKNAKHIFRSNSISGLTEIMMPLVEC